MNIRTTVAILAGLLAAVSWQTRDESKAGDAVRAPGGGAAVALPPSEEAGDAELAALPGPVADEVDLELD